MNANDKDLGHELKLKFGTAFNEPNVSQVELIKHDIQELVRKGITPTEKDWADVIKRYCPDAGSYIYKGSDTSDIITLLQLATKK